jgi:hypothetical protein
MTQQERMQAQDFGDFLRAELKKKEALSSVQKTELHPSLTVNAMIQEMNFEIHKDPRKARDFFNNTKNQETAQAFGIHSGMNTYQYREKHADLQDSNAQWRVQTANDLAYRNMINTHKDEMLKADWEQRDTLKHQHAFESSYFKLQEAKYDVAHSRQDSLAPRAIEQLEKDTHKAFREYKAEQQGIAPNTHILIKTKAVQTENFIKVEKSEPQNFKAPQLPSFAEKMLAMREKNGITKKPTLSRSM